jgi:hypothetical protein
MKITCIVQTGHFVFDTHTALLQQQDNLKIFRSAATLLAFTHSVIYSQNINFFLFYYMSNLLVANQQYIDEFQFNDNVFLHKIYMSIDQLGSIDRHVY